MQSQPSYPRGREEGRHFRAYVNSEASHPAPFRPAGCSSKALTGSQEATTGSTEIATGPSSSLPTTSAFWSPALPLQQPKLLPVARTNYGQRASSEQLSEDCQSTCSAAPTICCLPHLATAVAAIASAKASASAAKTRTSSARAKQGWSRKDPSRHDC